MCRSRGVETYGKAQRARPSKPYARAEFSFPLVVHRFLHNREHDSIAVSKVRCEGKINHLALLGLTLLTLKISQGTGNADRVQVRCAVGCARKASLVAQSFNDGSKDIGLLRFEDVFEPQLGAARRGGSKGGATPSLSRAMDKRLGRIKRFGVSKQTTARAAFVSHGSDPRQRAIVKVHYFSNAGGGGAALRAHGRYIARDDVGREEALDRDEAGRNAEQQPEIEPDRDDRHARYLSREAELGFYDAGENGIDGAVRMAEWSRADARHFRVILAPENGGQIEELKSYTREVMARAESVLQRGPLQWVAVDHWDTDNPHTHIVLRGRVANGRALGLPRDFVRHQFREIARDVATERIGPRSRDDERLSLDREVRRHGRTRLDRFIAERLDVNREVRLADLGRHIDDPDLQRSVRARADELMRLGLAERSGHGRVRFAPGWEQQLDALEAHLDIRRQVVRGRQYERDLDRAGEKLSRETGKPFQKEIGYEQSWQVRGLRNIGGEQHVALERWDAVTLAPVPRGVDLNVGQKLELGPDKALKLARGLGLDR